MLMMLLLSGHSALSNPMLIVLHKTIILSTIANTPELNYISEWLFVSKCFLNTLTKYILFHFFTT